MHDDRNATWVGVPQSVIEMSGNVSAQCQCGQ